MSARAEAMRQYMQRHRKPIVHLLKIIEHHTDSQTEELMGPALTWQHGPLWVVIIRRGRVTCRWLCQREFIDEVDAPAEYLAQRGFPCPRRGWVVPQTTRMALQLQSANLA